MFERTFKLNYLSISRREVLINGFIISLRTPSGKITAGVSSSEEEVIGIEVSLSGCIDIWSLRKQLISA